MIEISLESSRLKAGRHLNFKQGCAAMFAGENLGGASFIGGRHEAWVSERLAGGVVVAKDGSLGAQSNGFGIDQAAVQSDRLIEGRQALEHRVKFCNDRVGALFGDLLTFELPAQVIVDVLT